MVDNNGNEFWNDYAISFHFVGDFEDFYHKIPRQSWNESGERRTKSGIPAFVILSERKT